MHYFVWTKRSMFVGLCLFLSAALVVGGVLNRYAAVETAKTEGKKIPIYAVETAEPKIAITFDAAWGADDTDVLLSILEEYNAKITVFAVGDFVRKYPDAIQKFHAAGHEIANHSNKHTLYSKLSEGDIQKDIEACNAAIEKVTGEKPHHLRAPSGDYTESSMRAAEKLSMQTVQWSVDSLDWQGLSVEEIVARVTNAATNGSIVLFHNDVKNTPEALRQVLQKLSERGFSFVTVEELLYKENYRIDFAGKQSKLPEG